MFKLEDERGKEDGLQIIIEFNAEFLIHRWNGMKRRVIEEKLTTATFIQQEEEEEI